MSKQQANGKTYLRFFLRRTPGSSLEVVGIYFWTVVLLLIKSSISNDSDVFLRTFFPTSSFFFYFLWVYLTNSNNFIIFPSQIIIFLKVRLDLGCFPFSISGRGRWGAYLENTDGNECQNGKNHVITP